MSDELHAMSADLVLCVRVVTQRRGIDQVGARWQAADAWDTPRLATALTWLEHFVEATGRTLFMPARDRHSRGCIWNRRTIDLFIQHIVTSAPLRRTRGEHVSIDVARTYASICPRVCLCI